MSIESSVVIGGLVVACFAPLVYLCGSRYLEKRAESRFKVHQIKSQRSLNDLGPGTYEIEIWLMPGARIEMNGFRVKIVTSDKDHSEELVELVKVINVDFRGRGRERTHRSRMSDRYCYSSSEGWFTGFAAPLVYCRDESFRFSITLRIDDNAAIWCNAYIRIQSQTNLDPLMTCFVPIEMRWAHDTNDSPDKEISP